MPYPTIIVYKGKKSQTGLATLKEFPSVKFKGKNESFDDIAEMLKDKEILAVLPMWNSHEGEIHKARALDSVFNETAKIYCLWPDTIIFECISKEGVELGDIHSIVSVHVAKTQCSKFVKTQGASFIEKDATTIAYEEFKKRPDLDAALCAPGQNIDGYQVLRDNVSNPKNFTTFVFLGCNSSMKWGDEWGRLTDNLSPKQGFYIGVQMPIRSVAYSEAQEAFLNALSNDVERIDDIPKVLFVTKRSRSTCGLLIESTEKEWNFEIIEDDSYSDEIIPIPDLGATHSLYSSRILEYLNDKLSSDTTPDFIRHKGTQTIFYACPPIGIVTHGFEEEIVESVVKRIINKYFDLYANGTECSKTQKRFFNKYLTAHKNKGSDFIEFEDIAL